MPFTLAQLFAPDPAPLPSAPIWQVYLLEFPWPLAGTLVIAALLGAYLIIQRGKLLAAIAIALGGLCLTAGLTLLSLLIETPREQITWSAHQVVAATARADHSTLGSFLADSVSLQVLGSQRRLDRSEILARVKTDMAGRYALRGKVASVSRVSATIDGPGVGRTQFRLQATHDATGIPAGMWWVFHWRIDRDAWRLTGLDLVAFDGLPNDAQPAF
ncbi:MAG: hypothetical protein ACKVS8_08755 [Phycisphaerales bacterium]